ncbi:hypothetical protein D7X25_18820 [bacterium 1XD42-8]|nr:hypothetical protein D7X25_18820 [bacterium 1XD42-8]
MNIISRKILFLQQYFEIFSNYKLIVLFIFPFENLFNNKEFPYPMSAYEVMFFKAKRSIQYFRKLLFVFLYLASLYPKDISFLFYKP